MFLEKNNIAVADPLRKRIADFYRKDETACVNALLAETHFSTETLQHIQKTATQLILSMRAHPKKQSALELFLHEYDLSNEEGIALMCLAESLLRIPDARTQQLLISDKLSTAHWEEHLQHKSLFTNAATWSLLLTGKLLSPTLAKSENFSTALKKIFSRASATVIRPLIVQSMKLIGKQFVMGETIEDALKRAQPIEARGYRYSYDMLGEAARTAEDAERYFRMYQHAINTIGKAYPKLNPIEGPSISIKLSALHPRYEFSQRERVLRELSPKVLALAEQAKSFNMGVTIDAEEADRLELSLDIIEHVFCQKQLQGWEGFGLAVQAYQKRAPAVIDWLAELSRQYKRKFIVRLVKGAYWDAEIKYSQLLGLEGYPVFTRKNSTDVSYLACAKKLLQHTDCFYPQFGTHNAYSVATILEWTRDNHRSFEFQCLHGMGEALYDAIVDPHAFNVPCRIYAPVGNHKELLGYLVRRLLENGANTSFINALHDETISLDVLTRNPATRIAALSEKPHPKIPLPSAIYPDRKNSAGIDLSDRATVLHLKAAMEKIAAPIENIPDVTDDEFNQRLHQAHQAATTWANTPVQQRAAYLERAAELFEQHQPQLLTVLCREGHKQIFDCISELRETVDYCRYYAQQAREHLVPKFLPGPTGETNQLSLHPRGVIACISPWNFPLAIFTGQVTAALAAGNTVIAKPAEQTRAIARLAIDILHQAGIPRDVVQLLPGSGRRIGGKLTADLRIAGIMFTGSTETARQIQLSLANRPGSIVPLIAETGGINTMIVDSSALPEQVVIDVIQSAFNSAGQRCSALRVLYVQEEIAPRVLGLLVGAMKELSIGDPAFLATDVGPVIDQHALEQLQQHFKKMQREAKLIYQIPLDASLQGTFFAPCAFEIKHISQIKQEVFGPFLHVIRYASKELNTILNDITQQGYGLTMGVHSRITTTVNDITSRMPVGNIYVNRNMIGAVVGTQPFGGEQLSGTGPKAGGPHYLPRLCVERVITINTTATGGNATLVTLNEEEEET